MSDGNEICVLERAPGFLADSCLSLADRSPDDFCREMLYGFVFPALVVQPEVLDMGLRPHASLGGPVQLRSFKILNHHMWMWGQPFFISALPTSLAVASSINPWL